MRRIDIIKQEVSIYFEINPVNLINHKRELRFARPRQIAMWLCYKHCEMTYSCIARQFGKDHTTVIHAVRRVEFLLEGHEETKEDVRNIEGMLPWTRQRTDAEPKNGKSSENTLSTN